MPMTTSSEPASKREHLPLMRLAFRPFFLLAALFSVASLLVWLAFWHGHILLRPYGGLVFWHQHEMLFGFAAAVVAGFLLTAVRNWTGLPSLNGWPLLGVVVLWLSARILMAFPMGLSGWLLLTVDLAFLPVVAIVMAHLVITAKRWRNLVFIPVLLLFAIANLAMHLGVMQGDAELIRQAAYLAVLLITLMMTVVGGRVIAMFTANRLGRTKPDPIPLLEGVTLVSTACVVVLQLVVMLGVVMPTLLLGGVMLLAALANSIRMARWGGLHSWREPLLWGLHGSYACIPLGLVMWVLALMGLMRAELAIHALTIGGMGTMMLAMMSRVSLGHTGRPIRTLPGMGVALGLMLIAALVRSPVLALFPQITHWTYTLSIIFWCVAYAIFLVHYTWPLMQSRVDGQDG
ncbi:NnrS family protein [Halomonas sp. ISL-60]|uniref:NnrS family protein n=1 Tax=Halomonas sp. ISL-56 TaxID=2819149 RepID=UPI001BE60E9A|nr:NnrS family protein [Halomonas sp. ISL-56]MBT2771134.1 NnrS family protein [Halomonas sp. ISL-60]MBT2802205.1 NnrS family protein [Halomonas sp. ISL-56]